MIKFALKAAAAEVVPFLRRIESSLKEGQAIPEAYSASLAQTRILKHVIGQPTPGKPFTDGLIDGAKKSHLRSLIVFADQVKKRERSGASLKEAIIKSVTTTSILEETRNQSKRRVSPQNLLIAGAVTGSLVLVAKKLKS